MPIGAGNKELKKTNTASALKVSYFEIPVIYEISGNFLDFIKFKRAIAKSKKMLNFDKEMISVVQQSTNIISTGQLTIVGLPNEFN